MANFSNFSLVSDRRYEIIVEETTIRSIVTAYPSWKCLSWSLSYSKNKRRNIRVLTRRQK